MPEEDGRTRYLGRVGCVGWVVCMGGVGSVECPSVQFASTRTPKINLSFFPEAFNNYFIMNSSSCEYNVSFIQIRKDQR